VDTTQTAAGDQVVPNTPKHKGGAQLSYHGATGLDVSLSGRFVDSYPWYTGVFNGYVPAIQTVDASVGYRLNNYVRLNLLGTNILDQQRYQLYGGSIIGRRILGGVTATF